MSFLWPFLIYAVVSFVVSYILVEYGQKYLYDEVTPFPALKVAAGALIMAGMMTWTRSSFDTMFTADLPRTALMALVWATIFVLIYRFQPLHGAAFALATVLLLPGLSSMAVQGMLARRPDPRTQFITPSKPLRKGSGPMITEPAKPAK